MEFVRLNAKETISMALQMILLLPMGLEAHNLIPQYIYIYTRTEKISEWVMNNFPVLEWGFINRERRLE